MIPFAIAAVLFLASATDGSSHADRLNNHSIVPQAPTYKLTSVRAQRGLGPRAYTAEIQILGFPASAEAALEVVQAAFSTIAARSEACTVYFRVHSPQSAPSEAAQADMGTAFARSITRGCGGTSWTWENHILVVAAPLPSSVALSKTVLFTDVPLPNGSRFKRDVAGRAGPCRVYSTSFDARQIRDFYRQEMITRGYREWPDLSSDHTGTTFDNAKQTISIFWGHAGEIEIQREAAP